MGRPKGSKNTAKKTVAVAKPRSNRRINTVPSFVNAGLLTNILSGQPVPESDRLNLVLHLTGGSVKVG